MAVSLEIRDEQLLQISAQPFADGKLPGTARGDLRWHGSQPGCIVLTERNLIVE